MYEAIYLPGKGDETDPSKKGFRTEDEAWEYIESRYCEHCQTELEAEKRIEGYEGFIPCSGEWMVDEEE